MDLEALTMHCSNNHNFHLLGFCHLILHHNWNSYGVLHQKQLATHSNLILRHNSVAICQKAQLSRKHVWKGVKRELNSEQFKYKMNYHNRISTSNSPKLNYCTWTTRICSMRRDFLSFACWLLPPPNLQKVRLSLFRID